MSDAGGSIAGERSEQSAPSDAGDAGSDVLVIIPTYNEAENLPGILDRVRVAVPDATVLVVDDGSPDGTGGIADARAVADAQIHVMHRSQKNGLGAAYVAGFGWGLERGFQVLVEMDADGSHAPEQLPRLLAAVRHADLVIGSRYVRGGSVVNWPRNRELLSRGANLYTRVALGTPVRDITAGYRAYRAEVLRTLPLDQVASRGYCFQIDLAHRAAEAGFRVTEVPITFTERQLGHSKMDRAVMQEALVRVTQWGAAYRWRQIKGLLPSASDDGAHRSAGAATDRGAPRDAITQPDGTTDLPERTPDQAGGSVSA